ncbi:MAG: ExbD/TolR family protein [Treponema sp.]
MNDFFKKYIKEEKCHTNLTSMIDVIFILLVFFMISTQFKNSSIKMQLPKLEKVSSAEAMQKEPEISANAELIFFNGMQVSEQELEKNLLNLSKEKPEMTVRFKGDKNISYQRFLEIYSIIERSGIKKIAVEHKTASD